MFSIYSLEKGLGIVSLPNFVYDQGRSHWRAREAMPPLPFTSISEPKKFQQFQFQTSGILIYVDFQKLHGPEISPFLPCILQFLDNLRRLFIFSN